jgi:hypothetical protein
MDRMHKWSLAHPGESVSAAVQGRWSGEEWRRLTDEERLPYVLQANEEKERYLPIKREYDERQRRLREQKEDGGEAEAADDVEGGEEGEVGEDQSELSSALSGRSLPRVRAAEEGNERDLQRSGAHRPPRAVATEGPPRPPSAMRLFQAQAMERIKEEVQRQGKRFLKGVVMKASQHPHTRTASARTTGTIPPSPPLSPLTGSLLLSLYPCTARLCRT